MGRELRGTNFQLLKKSFRDVIYSVEAIVNTSSGTQYSDRRLLQTYQDDHLRRDRNVEFLSLKLILHVNHNLKVIFKKIEKAEKHFIQEMGHFDLGLICILARNRTYFEKRKNTYCEPLNFCLLFQMTLLTK